ncbi:MAG TPA: SIMPL domain-containing protein [Rhizomicrobium sp.]
MSHARRWLSGAALAVAMAGFGTAHADDATPHILTVSGQGDVHAVPDQAQLSAGVVTEGKTAAAALVANSRAMNAVFAAIRKLGVPEKSIQTSNFEITPQYTSDRNDNTDAQRIIGYQASNQVTVILDDVSKVGPTLDTLVASGANQANSIAFGMRDNKALLEQARAEAVKDATAHAQTLAKAAGVTLGPILSIQEDGGMRPTSVTAMTMEARAAPTPIAAGEQSVSTSVTITWEIK